MLFSHLFLSLSFSLLISLFPQYPTPSSSLYFTTLTLSFYTQRFFHISSWVMGSKSPCINSRFLRKMSLTFWSQIPTTILQNLVERLHRRVEVIIKADGGIIWNSMFKKDMRVLWSSVHIFLVYFHHLAGAELNNKFQTWAWVIWKFCY